MTPLLALYKRTVKILSADTAGGRACCGDGAKSRTEGGRGGVKGPHPYQDLQPAIMNVHFTRAKCGIGLNRISVVKLG